VVERSGMQEIFKSKLLELRRPSMATSFAEALCGQVLWASKSKLPKMITPKEEGEKLKEAFSEKQQVIESLERFVEEKTQTTRIPIIPVAGGEIALKKPEEHDLSYRLNDIAELEKHLSSHSYSEIKNLLENREKNKIEVLFVTETFRPVSERESVENPSAFTKAFLPTLPLKTSELFERMVMAMKLVPEEVVLLGLENEGEDLLKAVMSVADYLRPQVIVTLGAKSTQRVLKSNDRLTMVHGQFFGRRVGDWNAQIVPLFHPSIIETNQNMKKTAWIDMQKIMKTLKKI
jgi:hypothetical protein